MDNTTLVKLATLTHNRTFTRKEWAEYGGTDQQWHWLRTNELISSDGKNWYPTAKGWEAIDSIP